MTTYVNHLGQEIGFPVPDWQPPAPPPRAPLVGRLCRLEPLEAERHARALHAAYGEDREGRLWTYLPYGPFRDEAEYRAFAAAGEASADPRFYAIVDPTADRPTGVASYLRIDPPNGSIEVGHLAYSPRLQRTPAATEAMYLMMRQAFDLGYRRYEWKCNALNGPSRAAAERLGFTFEGVFRRAMVVKGQNRDTAWFSVTGEEWPVARRAFEAWLDPANFDERGVQRASLSALRERFARGAAAG